MSADAEGARGTEGPTEPTPAERRERLVHLLRHGTGDQVREFLGGVHPSDVADVLEVLDEETQLRLLSVLPAAMAAEALAEMEEVEEPGELLADLSPQRIDEVVRELADDDAADLIGELDPEDRARVLSHLRDAEDASEIQELLEHPEDTAGGIMTREMVAVPSTMSCGEAIEEIRRQAADHEHEEFYNIFVVDPDRELRGIVALQDLVLADPGESIVSRVEDPPAVVPVGMDQEEVGRILSRYNLASIGVVDPLHRLVGRITFDDVIDVIEAETTEDILRFASVSEEERIRGGTRDAVRSRLPWLVVNLFTAALAASVVLLYEGSIAVMPTLAVVMPVIAGMGGNAGTQALAVTIRRIALSDEDLSQRWQVVGKEVMVGLINGLVLGLIVAVAGLVLDDRPLFGLVVMLAMWGNLVVASSMGAFIPILLESLGVDPAVASSIFVTTLTDLAGFFLLLGLATALLI